MDRQELIQYLQEVIKWESYRIEETNWTRKLYSTYTQLKSIFREPFISYRISLTPSTEKYSDNTIPEIFTRKDSEESKTLYQEIIKPNPQKTSPLPILDYCTRVGNGIGLTVEHNNMQYRLKFTPVGTSNMALLNTINKSIDTLEPPTPKPERKILPVPTEKPKGLFGSRKLAEIQQEVAKKQQILDEEYNEKYSEWAAAKDQLSFDYWHAKVEAIRNQAADICADLEDMMKKNLEMHIMIFKTLKDLYCKNIIFSKYWNIIACTTFLEYLQAGRCEQLEGQNGCYNIYENEIRLDRICDKLDVVIQKLDDIQRNQYALYRQLQQINETTQNIEKSVADCAKSSQRIAQATELTAYYAGITAANTTALKYIALLK